jgi:hypothetical protein
VANKTATDYETFTSLDLAQFAAIGDLRCNDWQIKEAACGFFMGL